VSVVAPPELPRPDELEALIREARARQRRRWVGAAALVAVLAGAVLGISSLVGGTSRSATSSGGQRSEPASASRCGVSVKGAQVFQDGRAVYREPVSRTFGHQIECSGSTVWVVFFNGVAASQEAYFGVRSGDAGHSWRVVFAERFFNVEAPHELVTGYLGPWTLAGPREAYFTGICVACGRGTVSLWVTKDAGRTFSRYPIPALTGYGPRRLRFKGQEVIISAQTSVRGVEPTRKTVAVRLD
jgi:hypothetical protein